ncbi:peptidoglycan recognition family protein [Calothrix sp. UHCC 0171]|uniref:N-acetylmuramoyl-L-alanine amidase n=1 Tax=Calothrix sp. UHCC 0171 TaxID=3110245 RepID=UPI002B1FB176|nr:peptidoglycan recognition family protein [Calothrix sp. UHCC 0171]MEA5570725.1 peptidoglycan recognition family protein [Calothrix sp. UHCC 0171]
MRDSVWITRLLAISLVILAAIVLLLSNKEVSNSNLTANSQSPSEQKAWSPANVQYQSAIKPTIPTPSQSPDNQVVAVTPKPQPIQTNNQKANQKANQKNNQVSKPQPLPKTVFTTTATFSSYQPKYTVAWADPSNYGDRFATDIHGMPLMNPPIIVLHETTNSAQSAVNTFKTNNSGDENRQVSYHTLIARNGLVVYLVPPDKRAFGAGNSVFEGAGGIETVQTNLNLKPSVNNFAYHVSLETPPDAWDKNVSSHSGYTDEQYYALAWLIAQSDVPDDRITTHRAVDRSGQRIDPVSFDFDKFFNILHTFRVKNA